MYGRFEGKLLQGPGLPNPLEDVVSDELGVVDDLGFGKETGSSSIMTLPSLAVSMN